MDERSLSGRLPSNESTAGGHASSSFPLSLHLHVPSNRMRRNVQLIAGALICVFALLFIIHRYDRLTNYSPTYFIMTPLPISVHSKRGDIDFDSGKEVTRILHQSWKTSHLPPRFAQWSATWRQCFPDWEYRLWNNTENRDFLAKFYPWFLNTYDKLPEDINRADAVRYFYLFHYGGIYTDLDNECLNTFEPLLANFSLVFGAMEGQYGSFIQEGYVQNSFMYSRPRETFWLELIMELMVTKANVPEALTGPILLVKVLNQYRARSPKHRADVKIYPPQYFNPFSWLKNEAKRPSACKVHNQMTPSDMQICRNYFVNTSFVVQYHTQTWARGPVL